METTFSRTELLLGKDAVDSFKDKRVAIFGVGGVGGYVCEALVRSGIGKFDLIDSDEVSISNINRQIIATTKTVGRKKVEVMKERMLDINPKVEVNIYDCFFLPENADEFPFDEYDYVVDAVDTVTAKIELVMKCNEKNVPIISSMGAGNKLDPTRFQVADLYKTKVCPLAKVMRKELKQRGIKKLKVVYSEEMPMNPKQAEDDTNATKEVNEKLITNYNKNLYQENEKITIRKRTTPGSVAFVPSVVGLIIASEVIKELQQMLLSYKQEG